MPMQRRSAAAAPLHVPRRGPPMRVQAKTRSALVYLLACPRAQRDAVVLARVLWFKRVQRVPLL